MTRPTEPVALATAAGHLAWCAQIPHTVDQVVGIYAEALVGRGRALPAGRSNAALVEAIKANAYGSGGMVDPSWSDPTANAALHGEPDAIDDSDQTLGGIDSALAMLDEATHELAVAVGALGPAPAAKGPRRTAAVQRCELRIIRAAPHAEGRSDLGHLIHVEIGETAAWLHAKATEIWLASRGEHKPVAVQREIAPCRICGTWRSGTIAAAAGRCVECDGFFRNHQCERTEAIVKRAEYGKGPTPAQMLEARAAAKPRRKRAKAG